MSTLDQPQRIYAFAGYRLDLGRGALILGETERQLRPKSFAVLRYLVEHAGCLVSRADLLDAVWAPVVVSDDSITQCLIEIRRALDDQQRRIIRTVPRRGYVLDAAVEVLDLKREAQDPVVASGPLYASGRLGHPGAAAATLGLFLGLIALLLWFWLGPSAATSVIGERSSQSTIPRAIAVLPFVDTDVDGEQQDLVLHNPIASAVAEIRGLGIDQRAIGQQAVSATAHEHYLQGRYLYDRRMPSDLQRARDHFQAAVEEAPTYARAWAGLAASYGALINVGELDPRQARSLELDAVRRALTLDPNLVEAHIYACATLVAIGDNEAAQAHRRRALELGPDHPLVLASSAGRAAWHGDFAAAISLSRRALAVDPMAVTTRNNLGHYLIAAGRYEEARAELAWVLERRPTEVSNHNRNTITMLLLEHRSREALTLIEALPRAPFRDRSLAVSHYALEQPGQAQSAHAALLATDTPESSLRLAEVYAYRGEIDQAFAQLKTLSEQLVGDDIGQIDQALQWELRASPFFIPMRSDPRWTAAIQSMDQILATKRAVSTADELGTAMSPAEQQGQREDTLHGSS